MSLSLFAPVKRSLAGCKVGAADFDVDGVGLDHREYRFDGCLSVGALLPGRASAIGRPACACRTWPPCGLAHRRHESVRSAESGCEVFFASPPACYQARGSEESCSPARRRSRVGRTPRKHDARAVMTTPGEIRRNNQAAARLQQARCRQHLLLPMCVGSTRNHGQVASPIMVARA